MANHDYSIANQSFPSFRTDLNNALAAIASTNSGTSAPSTTFANQIWYDSSANILYIRNEDNDANIPLLQLDQSGDVAATLATIIDILDASGTNTAGADLTIRSGAGTGTGAGGNIVLQTANAGSSGSSVNSHATAVTIDDAGQVGIGATPSAQLHVSGDDTSNQVIIENTSDTADGAPDLLLKRNSASPADNDEVGQILWQGKNDNNQFPSLAHIRVTYLDVTDTTEDAAMQFRVMTGGSNAEVMRLQGGNVAIGTTEISDGTLSILGKASGGVGGHCIQLGGDSGAGNQGGVISFRQKGDSSQRVTSWVGLAGFDNGSTRQLYYGGGGWGIENATIHAFYTNPSYDAGVSASLERMRILSDGTVLIAQSANDSGVAGHIFNTNGSVFHVRDAGLPFVLNRLTNDGAIVGFRQDGSTDGQINVISGDIAIGTGNTGFRFGSSAILPHNMATNALRDNAIDLGSGSYRYDDIFATNTTIQTSDQNEKQQIASLTDAEITAAKAISKLFKTFKWNDSVEAKGDNARTHTGHIAQEVQSAMNDAGLDATKYAFFCSDTWWETKTDVPAVEAVEAVTETQTDDDGNEVLSVITEAVEAQDAYTRVDAYYTAEDAPKGATERTRLGIRYPELLAFIGAATEQRLTSIESRLTALEG